MDLVRHLRLAQRLLHRPRLGVEAVEHREVAPGPPLAAQPRDLAGHEAGLLLLALAGHHPHRLAGAGAGPELLGLARGVLRDHAVGAGQDVAGGAVVLLQPHLDGAGEVALVAQDVLHLGAPPAVDGLVVVAHGADVHALAGQQLEQLELAGVGVLVLVHQQVAEARLVLLAQRLLLAQQLDRPGDEIVEVDGALGAQRLLVAREDLGGDQVVVVPLPLGPGHDLLLERVLGPRDLPEDAARVEGPVVHLHLAHAALHQRLLVAGVGDGEPLGQPGGGVLLGEQPEAEGVEGGDPHLGPGVAGQGGDPLPHLGRRLVGEGDGQDGARVEPLLEQPGHAVGDDPGLARAGAGQDQQRPLGGLDRLELRRVERGEVEHGAVGEAGFSHAGAGRARLDSTGRAAARRAVSPAPAPPAPPRDRRAAAP